MRGVRLIVLIASATALLSLGLPAVALAGTFTWSLPANFTTTDPGANPDHDAYGARPWSYDQSGAGGLGGPSHDPSGFTQLPIFSRSYVAPLTGLVGWGDDGVNPGALIATNPTGSAISSGNYTFPAGELALRPPADRLVAIGWTSPLPGSTQVTVSGSVNADAPSGCVLSGYSWSLDQNGTALQTSASGTTVSATPTVPGGGSIYLTISPPSLLYNAACATAAVSLTIRASASAPQVTLTSPANGALLNTGTPTFSGAAGTGFGVSNQVTVRIYGGSSTSGTPVQTLTTTASGGSYSVAASSPLPDGLYTARAEQQNLASPPDTGLSSANSFAINNTAPKLQLSSLGTGPLRTGTPTLSGVGGTASGDAGSVRLFVYPGPGTTGTPVRGLSGSVDGHGRFSIQITPALADGQYTAVAAQSGPNSAVGFSNPVVFSIKVHPPALTLTTPAPGSNVSSSSPVFAGAAGGTVDDAATVTVKLYAGGQARGKSLGKLTVTRSGATWAGTWPHSLGLGLYTAVASQKDDAGHTATTPGDTFLIVPGPTVIGANVSVSGSGLVGVPVKCSAPAGETCTGNVLVTTVRVFRPVADGPNGHLSVMFAYVTLPGGATTVVHGLMQAVVRRTLRRARLARVNVTSLLSTAGAGAVTSTATRLIRVR